MLKILGSVLVLLSCLGLGFSGAEGLRLHCRELRLLKQAVYMLRGDIRYSRTTLPEAFAALAERTAEPISGLFLQASERLRQEEGTGFSTIWEETVENCLKNSHLRGKEREQLRQLGQGLGYLDLEMQTAALELYLEQLEQSIGDAEKEFRSKQKVYQSLGAAGGLFLIILLL